MEVIEKSAEGLARQFAVKITAAELDAKLDDKLEEIKGQVHLKGFRPGKAPVSFLKKNYGKSMLAELIDESMKEADEKIRDGVKIATPPKPALDDVKFDDIVEGKSDLEYTVDFEVLPEITTMDIESLELTKMVAEAPEDDVKDALDNLAKENREFNKAEDDVVAADGHRLIIDFVGKIDDVEFEGGKGEGITLEIGSGQFIPGFEEQLVGAKAGDEKTINVTFPTDYGAADLAGKEASFDVAVTEIQEAAEAEVNDELAKKMGLDDVDALTARIKERLEVELTNQSRMHMKREILDKLNDAHEFELPQGMVDAEFEQIWTQVQGAELDEEDKEKSEDELKAEYQDIAARRVRLGLVLAELGNDNNVEVPQDELNRALQMQAMQYQMPVEKLLEAYQGNPGAWAQLRAPLFEDKVVDFIIEKAKVEEKSVSKEELMKDPDEA